MTPTEFFDELAEQGFCFNITYGRGPKQLEYGVALLLPQAERNPPTTNAYSLQEAADWLEGQIISWFPESDYAKRLVHAKAVAEQAKQKKH